MIMIETVNNGPGIVHLTDTDLTGGAARAAYLLHRGLREAGANSSMLVNRKTSNDTSVATLKPKETISKKFQQKYNNYISKHKYREFREAMMRGNDCLLSPSRSITTEWQQQALHGSIIHLHWVAGCIDTPSFFKKANLNNRFVWTLHDYWPLTGGCHYTSGCRLFKSECGNCPQILSKNPNDITHRIWKEKSAAYTHLSPEQMIVVAPSKRLANDAMNSSLLSRFPALVIPYGIDTKAFSPRNQVISRESLGIPAESFVIAFVADKTTTPRKGFDVLRKALERVEAKNDIILLCVGSGRAEGPKGYRIFHSGRVENDNLLSIIYSASDVFIIPTREDNLPLTVLESLACGTPVVGADVGGVPDMVRPGETGFLFPSGDSTKLAEVISSLLRDRDVITKMRKPCRNVAVNEYSLSIQAEQYISLYDRLSGDISQTISRAS
jgi:glycosyltransferase involved in cell wall biosynthesis